MRELEEGSLWDFLIQVITKSEEYLLILGRLESLNTVFMVSTLGWPSLECQIEKETELQDVVLTTDQQQ